MGPGPDRPGVPVRLGPSRGRTRFDGGGRTRPTSCQEARTGPTVGTGSSRNEDQGGV